MYRAGVESILGINRLGDTITLAPHIPGSWPGFEATIVIGNAEYHIAVTRQSGRSPLAHFNGEPILPSDGGFAVPVLKDGKHVLAVALGHDA
jgi:cyclic beta-1,2-glucan synthetase